MHDAPLVRELERLEQLDAHEQRHADRYSAPSCMGCLQDRLHVDAVDVLHRDEERVFEAPEVGDLDDVRVVEGRRDLGLGDEPLFERGVLRKRRKDAFDRDRLHEAERALNVREKDLGHPAARDPPDELVAVADRRRVGHRGRPSI